MDILLGIILSTLTSMGVSIDTADSCLRTAEDSGSVAPIPCLPPDPTDTDDGAGVGAGLIKVGGTGLIKVGGSG